MKQQNMFSVQKIEHWYSKIIAMLPAALAPPIHYQIKSSADKLFNG